MLAISSITPVSTPALAPVAALPLPSLVQPLCCGKCGCGGKASALAGASPVDPLAALRGVTELG